MSKMKILVVSALCFPLTAVALPASAASTHDLQSGMHTTNSNTGGMTAMKKKKMHKMHKMM